MKDEEMKQLGRKELETIKVMVVRWRKFYAKFNDYTGGYDFLAEEFRDQISEQVTPYIARLFETGHITEWQRDGFYGWCADQEQLLRQELQPMPVNPPW
jgi:hypothetical protein